MRINRQYKLVIQNPQKETITITNPFTIDFNCNRDTLASVNSLDLNIQNLSANTRNFLYKDKYTVNEYWQCSLDIGYDKLYNVFLGNIYEAFSYKQRNEWITHISGFDGAFALQNTKVSVSVSGGTDKLNLLQQVLKSTEYLEIGAIGELGQGYYKRGKVFLGSLKEFIDNEAGGNYFIDCQKLNIMTNDEALSYQIIDLNSNYIKTTPKRRDTMLEVQMMMTPEIQIGGVVNLKSLFPIFNGAYKVLGVNHSGVISDGVYGDFNTTAQLYAGERAFKILVAK